MDVAGYTKSFSIDQGTVLGIDQLFAALYNKPLTDPKRNGICTGLSMIWLARLMMWHNESPQQRLRGLGSMGAFRWGGKTQDIHLAAGGAGGSDFAAFFQTAYGDALKAYVLRMVANSTVVYATADLAAAAKDFAPCLTGKHTYRLWNIGLQTPTGSAGHMVASYASGGKAGFFRHLYFFDPNMGEYKIDISQTQNFVQAWMQAYADTFTGVNYISSFAVQRG